MMDEKFQSEVEKATLRALDKEFKPLTGLGNGPVNAVGKLPTLTEKVDECIAALEHRIKLLEAIRSTL